LAYFLNLLHPGLKNPTQFIVIDTPENLMQALKKLVLLTYLNPFEFFFQCRKQVEVAGTKLDKQSERDMQCMPYSLSQDAEARLLSTEQSST
jgi:hypothetical protein